MRDSYFIQNNTDNQILIKARNSEPPIIFCDGLDKAWLAGRNFKILFNEMCIVYMGENLIQIFEIDPQLKLARKGSLKEGTKHSGIDTFGYDKIAVIDLDNTLRIYQAELGVEDIKIEKLHEIEVKGVEGREEGGYNVVVDPKEEYLLTSQFEGNLSSSISVYEIKKGYSLELKSMLDLSYLEMNNFRSLAFFDYFQGELAYFGKSNHDHPLCVFDFDPISARLRVVKKFSEEVKELEFVHRMKKINEGKLIGGVSPNKVVEFDINFF